MLYTSLGFWAFLTQRSAPKKLLNCFDNNFHDCGIFVIFKNVSLIKFLKKKKKVDVIVVHIGLKWLVPSTAF